MSGIGLQLCYMMSFQVLAWKGLCFHLKRLLLGLIFRLMIQYRTLFWVWVVLRREDVDLFRKHLVEVLSQRPVLPFTLFIFLQGCIVKSCPLFTVRRVAYCWQGPCLPRLGYCVQIHYRVWQLNEFWPLGNIALFLYKDF